MDLDDFTKRLFSIERRLELFSDRSAGLPWWDAVRYHVYEFLFAALTGRPAVPVVRRAFYTRALAWVKRVLLRAALSLRSRLLKYDVLVFRAPRQTKNNRPFDPGIDDLLALCPGRALTINTCPHYYHLPRRGPRRQAKIGTSLDKLMDALKSEIGGSWDESVLRRLIEVRLADFESALTTYRKLFVRVRPRLIIMTQNGMEKALFLAAHEAGICVVEGQHGLVGHAHPAYSYPRDVDYRDLGTFPAVFLAFSEYWVRSCYYPAGRVFAIGNDHFLSGVLPPPTDPDGIMFVSGDIYHDALSDWAMRLAKAVPEKEIIYKLHPNQTAARQAIQREFAPFKNIQVIDASISARAILPRVAHVVLIQSTVAMEALQAGRRVCIIPLLHYLLHKDLFQFEAVQVTPDLEHLVAALSKPANCAKPPSFFDAFDAAAAARLLRELFAASGGGNIRA